MAQATQGRDPICGMYVDIATAAHKSSFEGETYYFCSANCKRGFDANPAHYTERSLPVRDSRDAADAASTAEPLEQHEPPFTQSSGWVSPKFGSAGSGGAEYERLPEAHDRKKEK